jgi:monolysocardiolipin acyltransferase
MGAVGVLCRSFLLGASRLETHGMENFLELLDEREKVEGRQRGLVTGE